jgi:hypothetical protein
MVPFRERCDHFKGMKKILEVNTANTTFLKFVQVHFKLFFQYLKHLKVDVLSFYAQF